MQFTLAAVAEITGGRVVGDPEVVVVGAGNDSRSLSPGALFVALRDQRDGHDFVAAAHAAGAGAALVEREVGPGPLVIVRDAAEALRALGASAAERVEVATVGITGSVGKTSTKDLLAAACASIWRTHASHRSFNNEIGVPLTLLSAPEGTQVAIVEMGARGVGHIAELCAVAHPNVGVVTTVAAAHTELFGDIEQIALAKGELVEALPSSGTAVLNADDARVAAMASRTAAGIVSFGAAGDVRATLIRLDDRLRATFTLESPWGSAPVALPVAGVHMVDNALAAAAAALAVGTPLDVVADGLGTARLSPWRMEVDTTALGAVVVNDAYNANPTSMTAALDALAALDVTRRIAVLGIMAELGDDAAAAHRAVGARARSVGIEVIGVGVSDYGGTVVADVDGAIDVLASIGPLGRGDAVLVKGSRMAELERVAEVLLGT